MEGGNVSVNLFSSPSSAAQGAVASGLTVWSGLHSNPRYWRYRELLRVLVFLGVRIGKTIREVVDLFPYGGC